MAANIHSAARRRNELHTSTDSLPTDDDVCTQVLLFVRLDIHEESLSFKQHFCKHRKAIKANSPDIMTSTRTHTTKKKLNKKKAERIWHL